MSLTSPTDSRLSRRDYVLILLEVALLLFLVRQFALEAAHHLAAGLAVVLGGFAVHALLPLRLRLRCFLALSLGAMVLVLGPLQAGYALCVAAVLIAAATSPMPFGARVALLLLLAATLSWLRRGSDLDFWAIVGSMFMFRLIVYLYSIRKERTPRSLLGSWSYFLLLPNTFFPLFPVVDYRTFCDSYYNTDCRRVYQTGVHWMAVGVVHLLLYRLIKYELLPTPLEIRTARGVVLFLVTNYALYLRVSGQFHLICGMLNLFGFHLPRTHDLYFLASSFSDIWRRINVYWKDFMMKVCFLPAYFRLRPIGRTPALVLAVLWVFLWTWIGHSWQVFWLLGELPLHLRDALLWLGVGVVVAMSSILDIRRAASAGSSRNTAGFSFAGAVTHALKVIGVFTCVSVFWAKWSLRPDMFEMLMLSGSMIGVTGRDVAVIGGTLLMAVVAAVAVQYVRSRVAQGNGQGSVMGTIAQQRRLSFDESVKWHLALLIGLLAVSLPPIHGLLGAPASRVIAGLEVERVTHGDVMALIDGYYEQLNEGALQASPFLGDPVKPRDDRGGRFSAMTQVRRDLLGTELIPGWTGEFDGAHITVNRWGMRDRDRTVTKSPGTVRIALAGSSIVMGYGVDDPQTFSRLLEERLNMELSSEERRFEVLNFGMGQHFVLQRRAKIAHQVLSFDPDLILYFAHQDEYYTSVEGLAGAIRAGYNLEDPCLDALVRQLGLQQSMSEGQLTLVLNRHYEDVLRCTYRRIAQLCEESGVMEAFVYLPMPGSFDLPYDPRIPVKIARDAGLELVDLTGWEQATEIRQVLRGTGDEQHPGPLGHRLIADELFHRLSQHPRLLEPAE